MITCFPASVFGTEGLVDHVFLNSYPTTTPQPVEKLRPPKMIDHTGIGVADIGRSAAFYDAALGALGMRRAMQLHESTGTDAVGYGLDYPVFWIDRYHPHSVKLHIAFVAKSRAEVDAFHAAALKAGGTDNGAPGPREDQSSPVYYAAFVLDPDGNNMEAVFRGG
jgi:catechol 2,3-dioxygenase-like lactoylglutathione lyase family enzyme